jgi:ATP-dependent Zn protease
MSHCGDPRQELKALELLGKISEVGLFTTQTEVTVTHKTSDELADAIRERITRLLNPEEEKEKEILVDPEDELDIQDVEEYEEIEASPT